MALAYAPTTTDSRSAQHMSLTDRVRLRQMLALGMVEEVHVDGVTRYRATGTGPRVTVTSLSDWRARHTR